MSLGIFDRLWTLLEDDCIELDIKLATSSDEQSNSKIAEYLDMAKRRSVHISAISCQRNVITLLDEMVTYSALTLGGSSEVLVQLTRQSKTAHTTLSDMVM